MKTLTYQGTGTVLVEGIGEVSEGGSLELSDELAARLLEEQPQNWKAQGQERSARRKPTAGGD